ncbi:hypothetical protein B0H16DRAFT_1738351 [Mycena metata]|uniref:Uncharacterized protein n=1 Tax=Mycena metata TaxID=1033252 RepID=A0AAD7HIG2_9AGAR|nr:hypothetical protein B0H16DRAFT_1738351 [Mycena metata]
MDDDIPVDAWTPDNLQTSYMSHTTAPAVVDIIYLGHWGELGAFSAGTPPYCAGTSLFLPGTSLFDPGTKLVPPSQRDSRPFPAIARRRLAITTLPSSSTAPPTSSIRLLPSGPSVAPPPSPARRYTALRPSWSQIPDASLQSMPTDPQPKFTNEVNASIMGILLIYPLTSSIGIMG